MVWYRSDANKDDTIMMCEYCGKQRRVGHRVSHANNRTKRTFRPNIQTVHVMVHGSRKRIRLCTRCLRSGRVQKVA